MQYLNNVLGIKDPIHKQKIALKAMDVVLFGPPKGNYYYICNDIYNVNFTWENKTSFIELNTSLGTPYTENLPGNVVFSVGAWSLSVSPSLAKRESSYSDTLGKFNQMRQLYFALFLRNIIKWNSFYYNYNKCLGVFNIVVVCTGNECYISCVQKNWFILTAFGILWVYSFYTLEVYLTTLLKSNGLVRD